VAFLFFDVSAYVNGQSDSRRRRCQVHLSAKHNVRLAGHLAQSRKVTELKINRHSIR